MDLHKHLIVILLACLISSCYGYQFYVGGRDGWVPNPSENYNHWAERMRFQVNDTLVFKYKKGLNSVLVVNKDDYDKCNTNNPIKKMDDGNSIFKFDHSGPFYFISGNKNDCENGSQKLITVVLAIRPPPPSPPTTPPSTPGNSPATSPATSPEVSPGVSPATSPPSQTPTSSPGNAPSPATSPSTSPATSPTTSPATSPGVSPATSPASQTPTSSPGNAPSPATSPATSPASSSSPATSPASSSSPATSPASSSSPSSSSTPGLPGNSPPGSVAPAGGGGGNSPPADIQSPTGSKNSGVKAFTTTTSAIFLSIILTIIISA